MDFDPKTIVYIIAGLIYLFSRSKKKDKSAEEQEEGDTTTLPGDWEETLRRLTGETKPVEQKPPPPPVVPPPPPVVQPRSTNPVRDYDEEVIRNKKVKDYDEEVIRGKKLKDWDEVVLARKQQRKDEVEAAALYKQQNPETYHHSRVVNSPLSTFRHEESEHEAVQLDFDNESLRKAFIYNEILTPRHF